MIYGKNLAHSSFKVSNNIYGVFPPTIDNIKTEHNKVKLFVDSLFFYKTGIAHNTKLKRILAASVITFHKSFLGIIVIEAPGKYKDLIHPHFHQTYFLFFQTQEFQW